MFSWLPYLFGWILSALGSRKDLVLVRISLSVSNCWRCTPSVHVTDYRLGTSCFGLP
jgi:hypothetical protein